MPQLLFEPSATKIDNDTYIVVPKNDTDAIDVFEGESDRTDIRSGSYRFIAKCNELVKDIIVGMYGNPTTVNGVKKGHSHSQDVIDNLIEKYGDTFLPEDREVEGETVSVYVITLDDDESLFETQEAAFTAVVNWVKEKLKNPHPAQEIEDEAEEGAE